MYVINLKKLSPVHIAEFVIIYQLLYKTIVHKSLTKTWKANTNRMALRSTLTNKQVGFVISHESCMCVCVRACVRA